MLLLKLPVEQPFWVRFTQNGKVPSCIRCSASASYQYTTNPPTHPPRPPTQNHVIFLIEDNEPFYIKGLGAYLLLLGAWYVYKLYNEL